jgi:hypothetical protein
MISFSVQKNISERKKKKKKMPPAVTPKSGFLYMYSPVGITGLSYILAT